MVVYLLAHSQMMGQSGWQERPSIVHQAGIIERDLGTTRVVAL